MKKVTKHENFNFGGLDRDLLVAIGNATLTGE